MFHQLPKLKFTFYGKENFRNFYFPRASLLHFRQSIIKKYFKNELKDINNLVYYPPIKLKLYCQLIDYIEKKKNDETQRKGNKFKYYPLVIRIFL